MGTRYGLLWLLLAAAPGAAMASAAIQLVNSSARALQTSDTAWTLDKSGLHDPANDSVYWTIEAVEGQTVPGMLNLVGQTTVTNTGNSAGTIGNIVVNLQTRQGKTWVTRSSNIANATDGDDATSANIHNQASSEKQSTFSENSASGSLNFMDATNNTVFSLVPQVLIAPGQTRALLFHAEFDNNVLGLAVGTPIRAEVIVSFGNSAAGNSTPNIDINGNGSIDADEARVRSVPARLGLKVPAAGSGNLAVTLTDTLDDITATGDVTFSDVSINLGATSGTVSANVSGGATGGSITNCAQLASADQTVTSGGFTFPIVNGVDLQACSTVDVAGTPPNCTPGAPGCGWNTGEMHTATQAQFGDGISTAGGVLSSNFTSVFGGAVEIGGTFIAAFTSASAVFNYLPAAGTASVLNANVLNPLTTSSGELGGEVLALQLNVDLSAAGALTSAVALGSLRFCDFTDLPSLNGQTVEQFLATANHLLSGGSAPIGPSTAAAVARRVNGAFIDGNPSAFAQASLVAAPSCGWEAGEVVTLNQLAWDSTTSWYTAYNDIYASTFGTIEVGIPGTGGFSLRFSTPTRVSNYFVQVAAPGALNADLANTTSSSSGQFGGVTLALRMNIDFSAAGALGGTVAFGTLRLCAMEDPTLNNRTVSDVLAIANNLLGGGTSVYLLTAINSLAVDLNASFLGGEPSTFATAHLVNGTCP